VWLLEGFMKATWLQATTEGGSRFQELDIQIDITDPSGLLAAFKSKRYVANAVRFVHLLEGFVQDWHKARSVNLVIILAGTLKMETSQEWRCFGAGEIILVDDRSGQGHRGMAFEGAVHIVVVDLPQDFQADQWAQS